MSNHSLEAERQAILARMQRRRENYRRMLTDGEALEPLPIAVPVEVLPAGPDHAHYFQTTPMPLQQTDHKFPRSTIMRIVSEHPLLCTLGVAAVVMIGPRRITRAVANSSKTIGTIRSLTLRNQSNIDLVARLLALAGRYAQNRNRHPHS